MTERVLVIGLDGATPELLFPMARAGLLPNVARLWRAGQAGSLESTRPPMTLPAWSSFLTGCTPGRHGILDFVVRRPGQLDVEFTHSGWRQVPTLFRVLSDRGLHAGHLCVPTTYPPERLTGPVVAGFDSPVAIGIDESFCEPPSLYPRICREVGELKFADFQELRIGSGWHERARDRLLSTIAQKEQLTVSLLRDRPHDLFMVLFGESDTVSHHFWWLHDADSPRHDAGLAARLGDTVVTIYRRLDQAIGRILAADPGFSHVILCSDHGFGGASDRSLYLNRWLEQQGLLRWQPTDRSSVVGEVLGHARARLTPWLPPRLLEKVVRRLPGGVLDRIESRSRLAGIDLPGTLAFSDELNYAPSIWLHSERRGPGAPIALEDVEDVLRALTERLLSWRDPIDGEPVVERVWRREELFCAPAVEWAADLYLELRHPQGYSYNLLPSRGSGPVFRQLQPDEYAGAKGQGMNGSHRQNGIHVWAGAPPSSRDQAGFPTLRHRRIAQLLPEVLAQAGHALPDWIDGLGAARAGVSAQLPGQRYSAREDHTLKRKLAAMGYL